MPKLKKTGEEICHILFKNNLRKHMEARQITDRQMALYLGMAQDTFRKKKLHTERFRYSEVMQIIKKLGFSDEEILEVIKIDT